MGFRWGPGPLCSPIGCATVPAVAVVLTVVVPWCHYVQPAWGERSPAWGRNESDDCGTTDQDRAEWNGRTSEPAELRNPEQHKPWNKQPCYNLPQIIRYLLLVLTLQCTVTQTTKYLGPWPLPWASVPYCGHWYLTLDMAYTAIYNRLHINFDLGNLTAEMLTSRQCHRWILNEPYPLSSKEKSVKTRAVVQYYLVY